MEEGERDVLYVLQETGEFLRAPPEMFLFTLPVYASSTPNGEHRNRLAFTGLFKRSEIATGIVSSRRGTPSKYNF